jgi:hypothetical protein
MQDRAPSMTESRALELESEWDTQEIHREDSDRGTNADEDTTWEPNPLPLMVKHPPRVIQHEVATRPGGVPQPDLFEGRERFRMGPTAT